MDLMCVSLAVLQIAGPGLPRGARPGPLCTILASSGGRRTDAGESSQLQHGRVAATQGAGLPQRRLKGRGPDAGGQRKQQHGRVAAAYVLGPAQRPLGARGPDAGEEQQHGSLVQRRALGLR